MRRIATGYVVWALLAATALGVAGCGGDDQATTDATTQAGSGGGQRETGEQSVENFGSEASGSDRAEILAAERGYFVALAEEDYRRACAHLSGGVQDSLAELARGNRTCPQILPGFLSGSAPTIARQMANGTVTRVRVEGDQAFVIFRAPGAKLYVLTMNRENGEWKPAMLTASVLVPELE